MVPPPADLRKIGLEGFALIDKFYGPQRRSSANDAFPGRRERSWVVYQMPNDHDMEEPAVNFKDATGISVVNYPKDTFNRLAREVRHRNLDNNVEESDTPATIE